MTRKQAVAPLHTTEVKAELFNAYLSCILKYQETTDVSNMGDNMIVRSDWLHPRF